MGSKTQELYCEGLQQKIEHNQIEVNDGVEKECNKIEKINMEAATRRPWATEK